MRIGLAETRRIRNLKKLIQNKIQESELRFADSMKRINKKIFGLTLYLANRLNKYHFSPYMVVFKNKCATYADEI